MRKRRRLNPRIAATAPRATFPSRRGHTHPAELTPPASLAFMAERHLATFTTLRRDGSPHAVPVGFTWDLEAGARPRVISSRGSAKVGAGPGRAPRRADPGRRPPVDQPRGHRPRARGRRLGARRRAAVCGAIPAAAAQPRAGGRRARRRPGARRLMRPDPASAVAVRHLTARPCRECGHGRQGDHVRTRAGLGSVTRWPTASPDLRPTSRRRAAIALGAWCR